MRRLAATFALLTLTTCQTAPTAPTLPAPAPEVRRGDTTFSEGISALKLHQAERAVALFDRCLAQDPDRISCRWERGWANAELSKWEDVVSDWEAVRVVDAKRPRLTKSLAEARVMLQLARKIRASQARPAASYASKVRPALVIKAVGDVNLGTAPLLVPAEGAGYFDAVKPLLAGADIVFGNLEGPFCDAARGSKCEPAATPSPAASPSPGPSPEISPEPSGVPSPSLGPQAALKLKSPAGENCFAFHTPVAYAKRLAEAGFTLASLANNHALDFGEDCRASTEQALDALGLRWSGRPGTFASFETNGLKIAMVAFHTSPLCNDSNDLKSATALVRSLKESHAIVIVSFHGGAEGLEALNVPGRREFYFGEDRGDVRAFARAIVDAGADVVLGSGPHVPRAIELHHGRLIAYSLGNFSTFGKFSLFGHKSTGLVLEVGVDRAGRFTEGRLLPTRQWGDGLPAPDPEGRAIDLVRYLSRRDFPKSGVRVARDGTIQKR